MRPCAKGCSRGARSSWRPGLDDKVLADWNGLMIAALVRAALMLDRPDWLDLARRAYRFVAETMSSDAGSATPGAPALWSSRASLWTTPPRSARRSRFTNPGRPRLSTTRTLARRAPARLRGSRHRGARHDGQTTRTGSSCARGARPRRSSPQRQRRVRGRHGAPRAAHGKRG